MRLIALALVAAMSVTTGGCGPSASPASGSAPASASPEPPPASAPAEVLRFVALGDSYTIGTSVTQPERWPDQLVERLRGRPARRGLDLVANLAVNGVTSGVVLRTQVPALDELRPGFVSLLVGVNDVVQGVDGPTYAANVAAILDALVARVGPSRVLCVETPDYTVTPAGGAFGDPVTQRAGIERNNRLLESACAARGVAYVGGILERSREAGGDRTLVAGDGLHPSGAQYARWVDLVEPVVRGILDAP